MSLARFNLTIPVKFVAVPALAIFAVGTGAVAAYVTAPTPAISASAAAPMQVAALPTIASPAAPATAEPADQTEQAKPQPATKRPCAEQTWPYIDNRCIAGSAPDRKVRVVSTKPDDAMPRASASRTLVTSDTVLRGPGVAPEFDGPAVAKKSEKRKQARKRDRSEDRRTYSAYSVPSASGSMRPVIVVRPLSMSSRD